MRSRRLVSKHGRRAAARVFVGGLSVVASVAAAASVAPLSAQTIRGTLMDLETGTPIDLGLVVMFTQQGDSIGLSVTDEQGRFSLTAREPGSFILLASALGYKETPAGVFELGEGGVMDVEYRIAPDPVALDELVVSLNRPIVEHRLVRNGYIRRMQRGLGAFVTPHDIEESPATSTEDLLAHVPGIRVADIRTVQLTDSDSAVSITPRSDLGQTVEIRSPTGGWCSPTVYLDGARVPYATDGLAGGPAMTLSSYAPLGTVQAVEVYRRAAEIPPEYSIGPGNRACGVLVLWTRDGVTYGEGAGTPIVLPDQGRSAGASRLPTVEASGVPPTGGERIRLQLDTVAASGLVSPWEGTFLAVRADELVAEDAQVGRPTAIPMDAVELLQVQRLRAPSHAYKRGALAGAGFAAGMWLFLDILCRNNCVGALSSAWLPAGVTGILVGGMVVSQGPGRRWVQAPLPEAAPSDGR